MAETDGDHAIKRDLAVERNAKIDGGLWVPYLEIIDQKASGVAGGAFNANIWRTRDLTSAPFDDFATSVTLAASPGDGGQFVLPAGIYFIDASAPAYSVNEHVARLADVTDNPGTNGATVITGTSELAYDGAEGSQTRSKIVGKFRLTGATTLEIQHRCSNTQAGDGFGSDGGFYVTDNVYTTVKMWRVRDDT